MNDFGKGNWILALYFTIKSDDDDSDKPNSLEEDGTSTQLSHDNTMEDAIPRRGKKRYANVVSCDRIISEFWNYLLKTPKKKINSLLTSMS